MTAILKNALPTTDDEIVVSELGAQIRGYVTGFGMKDGRKTVEYQPGERPAAGTLGTKWCRVEDILEFTSRKMKETMKPGSWGSKDGKPAITWWRHGQAAKGEASIVTEVRTYATEVERVDAAYPPKPGAKPTRLGEGFKTETLPTTITERALA